MNDEGYIKFNCEWTRGPPLDITTITELNRWRRPLFDAGLLGQYEGSGVSFGNISMRSGRDGQFIISGTQTGHLPELSGAHYARVTACNIKENRLACLGPVMASSESLTHAAIYVLAPSIEAIVHVHSDVLWQKLRNRIPTTNPAAEYGTTEMAEELERLYRDTDFSTSEIAVMGGHDGGLISIGHGMAEAASRFLDIAATV